MDKEELIARWIIYYGTLIDPDPPGCAPELGRVKIAPNWGKIDQILDGLALKKLREEFQNFLK